MEGPFRLPSLAQNGRCITDTDTDTRAGAIEIEGDVITLVLGPNVGILALWFLSKASGCRKAGRFVILSVAGFFSVFALYLLYLWFLYPVPESYEDDWDYPFLVAGLIMASVAAATSVVSAFFAVRDLRK